MSQSNGILFQAFTWKSENDGTFWERCGKRGKELAEAGFTAVWLPPMSKGQAGADDIGYGVYDLFDLGEFDQKGSVRTRWGTRQQLEQCVASLNEAGLLTLADIVLNHRMGADATETFLAQKVNEDDRTQPDGEPHELEAWTRFTFPGRGGKYSDFGWRWHHFVAVDTPAHGGEEAKGIYRVLNKEFADDVGQEKGNYDYLMGCDVNLTQRDVREELFHWGRWFIEATGIGGFRVDAAKHMPARFIRDFLGHLRHETGKELYTVCEYASDRQEMLAFLQQTQGSTDCFDFALQARFSEASNDADGFDLRTLFDETLIQEDASHAVTFVDSHDTEPAQGGDDWVADWFKPLAYAAILLRRDGFPCVFAGDYDGRDIEPKLTSFRDTLDVLMDARRRFGYGDQHDHFDDPHRIAWVRTGDEDHPGAMAVVLSTGEAGKTKLQTHRPDTKFVNLMDRRQEITTDGDGHAEIPYPAKGLAVWITDAG